MRLIEYYLMPESGYTGEYDRKEQHYMIKKGTIADMIHDKSRGNKNGTTKYL